MNKNSDKQVNYGKNNTNVNIDELFIIINNGDKISAVDFFDSFADALEKYDTYMIDRFGKKIIVNKTGMEEDFSASKILKSLLTIGIPLDAAFTIFKTTITKLSEQHITGEKLETKEIRKKVCDSIQTCDLKKYAPSQIQSWSQKYVRKYGRNNQVVKVKMNNDSITEISRAFLKQFVVDLIQTISPNISVNSISNSNMREIADCVLDFVNSCDVYIIRYDVLKSIIMEIALQPPHPWFINDETKSTIISYDTKQLKTNLTKAKQCFNDGTYVVPQSILLEIIHHASSMILSKYDYFLGCNDLSSLHLLKSLLEDLINKPYEDLLLDEFPINKLLSDITKSDLKYDEYLNLIKHICSGINTQILNTAEFSTKVYNFGINSLSIIEKSSADFSKFYNQNWKDISLPDIMSNIMMFMNASFGYNEIKSDKNKDKCYFWYKLDKFVYDVTAKKIFFVFYSDNINYDLKVFEKFKDVNMKAVYNLILIISEKYEVSNLIKESVKLQLMEYKCANDYIVINLDKEILKSIFLAKNPPKNFKDYLFNNFFFFFFYDLENMSFVKNEIKISEHLKILG